MAETVYLLDGSMEVVLTDTDVFLERLIREKLGPDAARLFTSYTTELREELDAANGRNYGDLTNYEASLESNESAFEEIQEQASVIMAALQAPRLDRREIAHAVREIGKIINNQI